MLLDRGEQGQILNNFEQHLPRITSANGEQGMATMHQDGPVYMMLPCEVKDFTQFVAGLLGKSQELRGEVNGTFKIGYPEITNVYHLLKQRMDKQNDASLVHFVITVFYDDGQSVVHNKVEDFESFHPTTPCHPTAVKIAATYLIKFRGHETPEKQEIEVSFAAHSDYKEGARKFFNTGSFFDYRIVHTERTWATDIAGLLKNHAATVLSTPTGFPNFLRRYADNLAVYFSQLVFLVSIFFWSKFAIGVIGSTTTESESLKLAAIFLVKSVPMFALLAVMVVAIQTYVDRTPFFFRRAYIIFTEHDTKKFDENQKELFWGVVRYASVWTVTLLTGVLSSLLYSKNWFW